MYLRATTMHGRPQLRQIFGPSRKCKEVISYGVKCIVYAICFALTVVNTGNSCSLEMVKAQVMERWSG